jgi:uncharacterized protein
MTLKRKKIHQIRKETGWAYSENLWFSADEAESACEERDDLLASIHPDIDSKAKGTKLHTGPLSPGCSLCLAGQWGCNFINSSCTRNCFFCPQDRTLTYERPSRTDSMVFQNPTDHVAYIGMMKLKGVAFSGGEPLLAMDRLLAHINAIRKAFGDSIYIWIYTNGDLVDAETLSILKKSEINEIRFDLSARDYDITPLIHARRFIPRVSIEIPAIPEDTEMVKGLMKEWGKAGVDHLNIHQLVATPFNYRTFRNRSYHILHQPGTPVYESEISALNIIKYTLKSGITLPVHYCSESYKSRYYKSAYRSNMAHLLGKSFEQVTEKGYLRTITVHDSIQKIQNFIQRLQKSEYPDQGWHWEENEAAVQIHANLSHLIEWPCDGISIKYYDMTLVKKSQSQLTQDTIVPFYDEVYHMPRMTRDLFTAWEDLYIHKQNHVEVMSRLMKQQSGTHSNLGVLIRNCDEIMSMRNYECIAENLYDIF